jgi:hypothetical protein
MMSWGALARGHTDAGSGLEKSLLGQAGSGLGVRRGQVLKNQLLSAQKLIFQDLTPVEFAKTYISRPDPGRISKTYISRPDPGRI